MKPNPPVRGHKLLAEGQRYPRYLDDGDEPTWIYGCECGRAPEPPLTINATKRWHREHKAQLREVER